MPKINLSDIPDDSPKKLPMRLGLKNTGEIEVRCDSWNRSHNNTRIHQYYCYMNNWIPTIIGQSVDDAYSKFCKKFPAYMGRWTDTRRNFRECLNMDERHLRRNYRVFRTKSAYNAGYYVDENGIISHPGFEPVKRKEITLVDRYTEIRYNIDPAVRKPELLSKIKVLFGVYWYEIFKNKEYLTEYQYNNLRRLDNYDTIICYGRRKWNIDHKSMIYEISFESKYRKWKWGEYRINDDMTIGSFLSQVKLYPQDAILYEGTKEYNRYIAELGDAKRKKRREYFKEKRKQQETLLHDLEQMKKDKELELNIITRDRLGFDENSFKYSFYHGQKRKKRNKF
jgi:hypothetical protein